MSIFKGKKNEMSYQMPTALRKKLVDEFASAPKKSFRINWLAFSSSAVVAFSLLFVTFNLGRYSNQSRIQDQVAQEIVAGHVRSMMAEHLFDVKSTDQHTVKPWFEGKLDFGPIVKDFAEKEFPLIGGRLDYIDNRNVAALIYRHGQHIINVYEWPTSELDTDKVKFMNQRGFQMFTFAKAGLIFWVVSDLNATDLQTFVGLLQQ